MKLMAIISTLLAAASSALPTNSSSPEGSGTGPYRAVYTVGPAFANHTIFAPKFLSEINSTLPVIVWANGGCSTDITETAKFNLEIASWGFYVISSGVPGGLNATFPYTSPSTSVADMKASIDFAVANAGKKGYEKMDGSRIAAAGYSCGGIQAYAMVTDERVKILGIFNSGHLTDRGAQELMERHRIPTFWFLGGEKDIAGANGMRDYANMPAGIPAWAGNQNVGHGGTYKQPNGGVFGKAAQMYFRWLLKGDSVAATYFTGGGATADGWKVESKSMEKLVPV
ncbi:hypothetical protein BCR34DRAFT_599063 [Clohesyomyces aquaticus]|uniref:Alpha/Beta hydrolase protein n=1 Tax=Clohesyomyces aquaticus TaxID=1231657 RepID=A0A1Y1ZWF6_9PLEO|nr:hypothetical protein BCR34DRAFT_599063 [Clohesyomyces aquaticus]